MEASTSVQNNLLHQPSVPEPSTWHGDRLPGAEPSAYPFQGPGYERL
jgi:hypothetical protein